MQNTSLTFLIAFLAMLSTNQSLHSAASLSDGAETNNCQEFKPCGAHPKIVILGHSGVGKSTLAYLLLQEKLVAEISFDDFRLNCLNPIAELEISHSLCFAETRESATIFDSRHKRYVVDCPASALDLGPQEYQENWIEKDVFKGKVKIVLVIDVTEFTVQRGTSAINFLNKVTELFPAQDQLKKAVTLVVSKGAAYTTTQLNAWLTKFVSRGSNLTPHAKDLLEFITKSERAVSFPMPNTTGSYVLPFNIEEVLQKGEFVTNLEISPLQKQST